MELRRCSTWHFIQAIRDGSVVKVRSVNSHGRPALTFKTLKDIYEAKNAKGSEVVLAPNSPVKYADSVLGNATVNSENQSPPVVDRTLREMETENNEFVCCGSDDNDDDNDSDDYIFAKMTLKQLKERCKSKKRKVRSLSEISPKQEDANIQQEDDDLKVPLSMFKTKLPKSSKSKRRCTNRSTVHCSETAILVKTEQFLDSDVTMQYKGHLASLTNVKAEVPEHEFSTCQNTGSLVNFSSEVSVSSDVDLLPLVELKAPSCKPECSGKQITNSFTDCSSINCNEESSCSGFISSENPEAIEVQGEGTTLFAEEQQCLTLNNVVTNDNLECVQPKFDFTQSVAGAETNDLETRFEIYKQPHPQGGSLEIISSRDKDMDVHLNRHVISGQNSFESHVSDAILTGRVDPADIHHADDVNLPEDEVKEENCSSQQNVSPTSTLEKIFSSGDFQINSSTGDDFISAEDSPSSSKQLSRYPSSNAANSCLSPGSLQDESSKVDGKESPSMVDKESSTMKRQPSKVARMITTSELQQLPQRLPSMRKVISPSSQEGLRLAMNSADLFDEAENYKCKEKLLVEPGMVNSGADGSPELPSQVRKPRVIIRRNEIVKRLKITQTSFPHKVNSDSPVFSRSLPQLSTGCPSIDSCSESAIAFSKRQMHDFESLAMKLMDELKSMKDMVEEKLLFEAYRNASLKNEADEVRNTLNNTKKVEETARKWLTMMTRDCSRFCKLMNLSKNGGTTSRSTTVQKERKISFADEAGGMLCSVNYFDDTVKCSQVLPCENQQG